MPVVTVDEGMRAVLLLVDDPTDTSTFEQRKAELVRMGAFKDSWGLSADHTLDKGTLAYMLRIVCRLRPSMNERLAASTRLGERRYALRTCIRKGLFRPGLAADPVTGGELLSAITQAEPFIAPRSGEGQ